MRVERLHRLFPDRNGHLVGHPRHGLSRMRVLKNQKKILLTHPPRTRGIFSRQFADLEVKSGKWIILFLLTLVYDCFFGGWLRKPTHV